MTTDRHLTNNKPDIMVIDKETKSERIIGISIPLDENFRKRFVEKKITKYQDLTHEVKVITAP